MEQKKTWEEFNVSEYTVRKAKDLLRDKGIMLCLSQEKDIHSTKILLLSKTFTKVTNILE